MVLTVPDPQCSRCSAAMALLSADQESYTGLKPPVPCGLVAYCCGCSKPLQGCEPEPRRHLPQALCRRQVQDLFEIVLNLGWLVDS